MTRIGRGLNKQKSREVRKCGKCGKEIAVGEEYIFFKPRYGGKRIRCTRPECRFRPSEMTSSDKLSQVYAVQENFDDISSSTSWVDIDSSGLRDIASELSNAASEVQDVADGYNESAENIRNSFSASSVADECEEKANECEEWANALEEASININEHADNLENAEMLLTMAKEVKQAQEERMRSHGIASINDVPEDLLDDLPSVPNEIVDEYQSKVENKKDIDTAIAVIENEMSYLRTTSEDEWEEALSSSPDL